MVLDEVWPEVSATVAKWLRTRGTPACDVDDAVQEAAVRAWLTRSIWPSRPTLIAWCLVTSERVITDGYRRRRLQDLVAELPEVASDDETATVAVLRAEFRALRDALESFSGDELQLLLGQLVPPDPRDLPPTKLISRDYVRRHRLRQKLSKYLDDQSNQR